MKTIFENDSCKVYMNSSNEIFVQNKSCTTTLRMKTNQTKSGISIALDNNMTIQPIQYGGSNGIVIKKD